MREEVLKVVSDALRVPRHTLTPETRLEKVLRDSIDAVELVALLGERFDIDIEPADLAGIVTLGDIEAYVTQHEGKGQGRPAF